VASRLVSAPVDPKTRYQQVLKETNITKKIATLRAMRDDPDAAEMRIPVLSDLWRLEYLVGDPAAIETCRTLTQVAPRDVITGSHVYIQQLIGLLLWQKRYQEAQDVFEGEKVFLKEGYVVDPVRLKQLLLAQGKYAEDRVRAYKEVWDQRGEPYLPWFFTTNWETDGVFPSIGDMREFSEHRDVPVRIFINFTHARSTSIPYLSLVKKATWNPLYAAFANRDPKNIEDYIARINQQLGYASGGRFSLKIESIAYGPIEGAVPGKDAVDFMDLAASPKVKDGIGKTFTFLIGDFLGDMFQKGIVSHDMYGSKGLVLIAPFVRDIMIRSNQMFLSMSVAEWIGSHEVAHGLGMTHRWGDHMDPILASLIGEGHLFSRNEEKGNHLDVSRKIQLIPTRIVDIGLSVMNRLRMGWILDDRPKAGLHIQDQWLGHAA